MVIDFESILVCFVLIVGEACATHSMSPCASPKLISTWGDPSMCILPPGIFFSLDETASSGNASSVEIVKLLDEEFRLLNAKDEGIPEADANISCFLKECASKQIPGVYTNGTQYCLAFIRRDMLRRYFLQLMKQTVLPDMTLDDFTLMLKEQLALSPHEIKWCRRIILSQNTVRDFEFGPILVVPEPSSGLSPNTIFTPENLKNLLVLLKDSCENEALYYYTMPQIVSLVEHFFAGTRDNAQIDALASAFATMIDHNPQPCSLWVLGYLWEEFSNNINFIRFLEKCKKEAGEVAIFVDMSFNGATRQKVFLISDVIGNFLNNGLEDMSDDIGVEYSPEL